MPLYLFTPLLLPLADVYWLIFSFFSLIRHYFRHSHDTPHTPIGTTCWWWWLYWRLLIFAAIDAQMLRCHWAYAIIIATLIIIIYYLDTHTPLMMPPHCYAIDEYLRAFRADFQRWWYCLLRHYAARRRCLPLIIFFFHCRHCWLPPHSLDYITPFISFFIRLILFTLRCRH